MRRRRLPLGALRASLGYMSRVEDVAALLRHLAAHYTDAVAHITTTPEEEVPLQLPSTCGYLAGSMPALAPC